MPQDSHPLPYFGKRAHPAHREACPSSHLEECARPLHRKARTFRTLRSPHFSHIENRAPCATLTAHWEVCPFYSSREPCPSASSRVPLLALGRSAPRSCIRKRASFRISRSALPFLASRIVPLFATQETCPCSESRSVPVFMTHEKRAMSAHREV